MKRSSIRIILLIVCVVFVSMATAAADGEAYGWKDFYSEYYGSTVPEIAQRIMADNGEAHFTLGPVDFSVGGQYCDGYIATISTVARLADGTNALLTGDDPFDAIGANGKDGQKAAERLKVSPDLSWAQAAKELDLPLYSVRAELDIPEELSGGEQMGDPMFNDDGSLTYFSLAVMNGKAYGEKVNVQVCLRVAKVNPDNPEADQDVLMERKDLSLFMEAPVDTKDYAFPENTVIQDKFRLDSVKGILMPAGLYMFCSYTALDGATEEDAYDAVCESEFVQPDGKHYPPSMDLTGCIWDLDNWPAAVIREMTSLDSFPDEIGLRLREDDKTVLILTLKK